MSKFKKTKINILYFIVCIVFLSNISCIQKTNTLDQIVHKNDSVLFSEKNNNSFDSIFNSKLKRRDSLLMKFTGSKHFNMFTSIAIDSFLVEIETIYLNDTLDEKDVVNSLVVRPIIQSQKLIFKKSDKIIKSCNIPLKAIYQNNYYGKKVKRLEINVSNAYIIKGSKGSILVIYGVGLCSGSACPEFYGYYSMCGETLYSCYLDGNKIYDVNAINKIYIDYGITDSISKVCSKNRVRVDEFWK